jgi:hypothetical protein
MKERRSHLDLLMVLQMDSLESQFIAGHNTQTENLPTTDEVAAIIPDVPADARKQLY